jgi:hypothetical protein
VVNPTLLHESAQGAWLRLQNFSDLDHDWIPFTQLILSALHPLEQVQQ